VRADRGVEGQRAIAGGSRTHVDDRQPGTGGAETILTVELTPTDAGFHDQAGVKQHEAWRSLLPRLEERLIAKNRHG